MGIFTEMINRDNQKQLNEYNELNESNGSVKIDITNKVHTFISTEKITNFKIDTKLDFSSAKRLYELGRLDKLSKELENISKRASSEYDNFIDKFLNSLNKEVKNLVDNEIKRK